MTFADKYRKRIINTINMVVLVLSVLLIVFISIDTFMHISFMDSHPYMVFQFWVCIIFMGCFFVELWLSEDRWRYASRNILFLLISIPYLNIINILNIPLDPEQMYFVRFIPLARGALAVTIIVSGFTRYRITGLFASYAAIMVLIIYFSSLIFLEREQGLNPSVTGYWSSLWWCCLESTTIGAPFSPVTVSGKILAGVLSCMGMLMFPLFTVYLTNIVKRYLH